MGRFCFGIFLFALLFLFSYSLVVFGERAGEAEGVEEVIVLNHTGELRSREREKKEPAVASVEEKQKFLEMMHENYEEKLGDVKRAIRDGNLTEPEVLEYVKEYLISNIGLMQAQAEYVETKHFEEGLGRKEAIMVSSRLDEFYSGIERNFLARIRGLESLNETEVVVLEFRNTKREFDELLEESAIYILKGRAKRTLLDLKVGDYDGILKEIIREEHGISRERLINLRESRRKLFYFLRGEENG